MVGGLVQQQNIRFGSQRRSHGEAFLPATGKGSGLRGRVIEADSGQDTRDREFFVFRFPGGCGDDFTNRHRGVKRRVLRNHGEADAFAHRHITLVGRHFAAQNLQER